MTVIGLTGGIGSGKSAAGRIFSQLGCQVIDTDQVSRKITAPGAPALAELCKSFGGTILNPDQSLNRKALAAIVFADEKKRRLLNKITHKYIIANVLAQIEKSTAAVVVVEAPLLFEAGMERLCDRVLAISASDNVRAARVMARDGASEAEAMGRISAQKPNSEYCRLADDIIENEGSEEALKEKIKAYLSKIGD